MRHAEFAGANVTIPHKLSVIPFCDKISELSQLIGAVNTLYFEKDKLIGTTTDAQGFIRALDSIGAEYENSHCVILGNGGTARTLGMFLAWKKIPASLTYVGRNESRITSLASEVSDKTGFPVHTCTLDHKDLPEIMRSCTLCVNCTNVGMVPHTEASVLDKNYFHKSMTVFDTIYNPVKTRFLAFAQDAGCKIQNGLPMLLYQGLESFTYWTGITADEGIVDLTALQMLISKD